MVALGFALAWTAEAAVPTWAVVNAREMGQSALALFLSGLNFLPDPASVGSDHFLSGFAAEGLLKFGHVGNHVVDAEDRQ